MVDTEARKTEDDRPLVPGEIERLDRAWEAEREGLMQRTKSGRAYAPRRGQAVGLALVPVLLFVFPALLPLGDMAWMVWALSCVMSLAIWAACWRLYPKANAYEAAEVAFRARRAELVARLESGD